MAEENIGGKLEERVFDENTVDYIFSQRDSFENLVNVFKDFLSLVEEMDDYVMNLVAGEYILRVLKDPNNQKRYGRSSLTFAEILEGVQEKEPRFHRVDIRNSLNDLQSTEQSKIERSTSRYITPGYRSVIITIYGLKEE